MKLVVQKFGGTSVGSIERIKNVANRVAETITKEGCRVVVVVSAMAGETDRLINLANGLSADPPKMDMDMLLSSGERVTTALLSIALNNLGLKAAPLTGRQVGIITDDAHTKAKIQEVKTDILNSYLNNGIIPVVAGFQGITKESHVTTLGRGGSDTTAVAIAAALKADLCHIFTDVDGVYTADPSVVLNAKRLNTITYEEMLELASLGAKVLHARSVQFAMKYDIPLKVSSSFDYGVGTLVTKENNKMEEAVVSGVTLDKKQTKITVSGLPDKPGIAYAIFDRLSTEHINVDIIIQNVSHEGITDISFTAPKEDKKRCIEILKSFALELGGKDIIATDGIAKISIVGVGMKSQPGVAAKMFGAFAKEGINIMMISTSEIKISCVIDLKYAELAVRVLHDTFELAN